MKRTEANTPQSDKDKATPVPVVYAKMLLAPVTDGECAPEYIGLFLIEDFNAHDQYVVSIGVADGSGKIIGVLLDDNAFSALAGMFADVVLRVGARFDAREAMWAGATKQ